MFGCCPCSLGRQACACSGRLLWCMRWSSGLGGTGVPPVSLVTTYRQSYPAQVEDNLVSQLSWARCGLADGIAFATAPAGGLPSFGVRRRCTGREGGLVVYLPRLGRVVTPCRGQARMACAFALVPRGSPAVAWCRIPASTISTPVGMDPGIFRISIRPSATATVRGGCEHNPIHITLLVVPKWGIIIFCYETC